jgi:SAM-dependent methyltransferase
MAAVQIIAWRQNLNMSRKAFCTTMESYLVKDEHARDLSQLRHTLLDAAFRVEMSPLFFDYHGWRVSTSEGIQIEFDTNAFVFNYLRMRNARVLDIGCGFGLRLICFALLGARTCVGIDISPEMISDFKRLKEGCAIDVEAICGDFLDFEFPEESFDIVIMNSSISHVRDTQSLLVKIRGILAPGGCLWIADENNGLFLPTKIKVKRGWKKSEHGPIGSRMATFGRDVDRLPFYEARIKIIQSKFPFLDEKIIRQLAKDTQGMFGKGIIDAVDAYITRGEKPKKASFQFRNPYTGEYPEFLFNPIKLARDLRKIGFRCRFVSPSVYSGGLFVRGQPSVKRAALTTYRRLVSVSSVITHLLYPGFTICAKRIN